jgi:hypothetical protein
MMKKSRSLVMFLSGAAVGAVLLIAVSFSKIDPAMNPVEYNREGKPQFHWTAPELPKSISFCGEKVPLERWEVRERLERELVMNAYQHGNLLYVLMLAGRYFPLIEERLRANGVPDDLKYVCVAESSLQQNALSGVGAASFWQFMKDTGPRYGLEINDEVDERFSVIKATDAACRYFKEAHDKFGSWTAAAASYNCGQAGYAKQADFQESENYYELIFPDETNRYVFRILALKYIISNAEDFGFYTSRTADFKPLQFTETEVTSTIENLNDFAREHNTTYKMLKIYNPWLRGHKLTVRSGKTYKIALPQ